MSEEGLLALVLVTVPVGLLYGYALFDVLKRRLPVPRTMAWIAAIILVPGIGVLGYYAMRPIAAVGDRPADGSGVADAVDALRARWESGDLDDTGYRRAKQQLFRV